MRHPSSQLTAYLEADLPHQEAQQVAAHLSECQECRDNIDQISFGMRLAKRLPQATAPDSLWPLPTVPNGRPRARQSVAQTLAWSSAALLLMFVLPLWYFAVREAVHVVNNTTPPSELEALALEQHLQNVQGGSIWAIRSTEGAEIRQWVENRSDLSINIPLHRPIADRIRLVGARLLTAHAGPVAEVGFVVDGQPVTLLTTELASVAAVPHRSRFHKDVAFRSDRHTGYKTLTWSSEGQAYVMTSALPGLGQQGCFLCHLTEKRRQLISKLQPTEAGP